MNRRMTRLALSNIIVVVAVSFAALPTANAQTCTLGTDMEAGARNAMDNAALQFFQMAQQGDTASLQRNSIPAVASSFNAIAAAVNDLKAAFAGAKASVRGEYLLDYSTPPQAPSGAPKDAGAARVEFFCGIYNSPDRVGFVFPQLPAGQYGVVVMDVNGKPPYLLSMVLQQEGGQWKLAGFYPKAEELAGHNAQWFLARAREFKQKGQMHNSWFYYQVAYEMWQPFPAMNAPTLDKLYDELSQVQPNDVPLNGPINLTAAGGKTYQATSIFATGVGNDLDIVVKYQTPDLSDTARAFQDNAAVIKALVTKFPELREAFAGVVARAVAPTGQDYGTLLAMKDIK